MSPSSLLTALALTLPTTADEGPNALFDGSTLDGWVSRGGPAKYVAVDGAIVGFAVPNSSNSFLCTERTYGDFILDVELKVDPGMNSGIQIRSAARKTGGRERVFGYQVEIDPTSRAWSGGIFDEGRRGWLQNLVGNDDARAAFDADAWNRYRIEAIGDRIRTWVNDVPAADLVDPLTQEGFIGLQVHGVGELKSPLTVRWRDLKIQDLGHSRWEPLFDGTSLHGWTMSGGGHFTIKDGQLVGEQTKDDPRHGVLMLDRSLSDFTVRVEFKAAKGNSGLYFRSEPVDGPVVVHGFQAEIDAENDAGGLYETGGRAWVAKPSTRAQEAFRPGKWNVLTIHAHGSRIVTHLNGVKAAELKDDPGRREGRLGLQLHGGQDQKVKFRAIELLTAVRGS